MPAGRAADVGGISALALAVTLVMAGPVLRAPSERLFGMEIAGRHHDPFTAMQQFAGPARLGVYSQPVTDLAGVALARILGPVAGYNWLVMLTFPLSAATAWLLARHLGLSKLAAALTGLAFAFSPFHLAQAAYHPHVAQTQWVPLYFLALWRCLDRPSPGAVACLALAGGAVALSNFYAGLIVGVLTPVAAAAYSVVTRRQTVQPLRHLAITTGALLALATAGIGYVSISAADVMVNRDTFAFPREDLFRYGARWFSYLVPPVGHPVFGDWARRVWTSLGVGDGLLEQQVSVGWGVVALAAVAVVGWRPRDRSRSIVIVPAIALVALVALACSLPPATSIGPVSIVLPSSFLYDLVPMFRSYARFGVVVQLMAALLAGIGLDWLRQGGTRGARLLGGALVTMAVAEYVVSPAASWRDVLPTAAHRWVATQSGQPHVLDCAPHTRESASIEWLSHGRIATADGSEGDCLDAQLAGRLAATGFTHLLVRRDTPGGDRLTGGAAPDGLAVAARFRDSVVYEVTATTPAVYIAGMSRFFPREQDAGWTWRWMGATAAWTIVNTRNGPLSATLDLELSAFHDARLLDIALDGRPVQSLTVEPTRRIYRIGPVLLSRGPHEIVFHPSSPPTVAGDLIANGDRRPLSFALGSWSWTVSGEQP